MQSGSLLGLCRADRGSVATSRPSTAIRWRSSRRAGWRRCSASAARLFDHRPGPHDGRASGSSSSTASGSSTRRGQPSWAAQELRFVPLGGVGEIGMNVYLYGLDDSWLMVDLGLTFANDRLPGADLVLPDISLRRAGAGPAQGSRADPCARGPSGRRAASLAAPALPDLVQPVYGAVLRRKFAEEGIAAQGAIHAASSRTSASRPAPLFFRCRLLHVTPLDPRGRSARARDGRWARCCTAATGKLDPAPHARRSHRRRRFRGAGQEPGAGARSATARTFSRQGSRAPRRRSETA